MVDSFIGPRWKDCHTFSPEYEGNGDVMQGNFAERFWKAWKAVTEEGVGAGPESEGRQESFCV